MFQQDIRCFIAVAETLNFTAAANRCYMTQPGLSKIISNLERDLRVQLFTRSTRNVQLTEAGEQFLDACREFLTRCDHLNKFDDRTLVSNLKIGTGGIDETRHLPKIINSFTVEQPSCNLALRQYTPPALLEALDANEVDLGVCVSYAIPNRKDYQYLVYYPSPLMVVVPPGHRFAGRKSVHISELHDEKFVSVGPNSACLGRIKKILSRGKICPQFIQETNSINSAFMLISSGAGIGLHFLLHKDSFHYDLRFIPLDTDNEDGEEPRDGAAIVWKKGNANPALAAFIDCVTRYRDYFWDRLESF